MHAYEKTPYIDRSILRYLLFPKDERVHIWRQFYRDLGTHYGTDEQWTFEPSVAQSILDSYVDNPAISIHKGWYLDSVRKRGTRIVSITCRDEDGRVKTIKADSFIDATYEGDLLAQADCEGRGVVEDGIGYAAYQMDSHNCERVVVEKDGMLMVKNEGDVEKGGGKPYPISYRSIVPKREECTNLLVPVCLSSSHIAFGSIRMEPVFLELGQVCGFAAAVAGRKPVQDVDVKLIQAEVSYN